MICTYSLSKDRHLKLAPNFEVEEFRCKDGSDLILIDDRLVEILQQIRNHFGRKVHISSAYRTVAYNLSVSGAYGSQHCKGTAADITVDGVNPLEVALYVSSLPYFIEHGGVGYYSRASLKDGFVHVDVRSIASRWISRQGTRYVSVVKIMPTIRQGCRDCTGNISYSVSVLQRHLGTTVDGAFGPGTKRALMEFQQAHGLVPDGVCGPKTWAALSKLI